MVYLKFAVYSPLVLAMKLSSRFSALALARLVLAGTFTVVDTYEGEDFINDWYFEAIEDPNHGTVYVVAFSSLGATC